LDVNSQLQYKQMVFFCFCFFYHFFTGLFILSSLIELFIYAYMYFYNLFLVCVCVGSVYRISLAAFEESVLS